MPARKYFKEEFDRILNEEFHGDKHTMRNSSTENKYFYLAAIGNRWTEPMTPKEASSANTKYFKEDFDRILSEDFKGDLEAMYSSSEFNRRLYRKAIECRWTEPLKPGRHKGKYDYETFNRILMDEFGGDKGAMSRSSHGNFLMYKAAIAHGWTTPIDMSAYRTKYTKEEFDRIFESFGFNVHEMSASSHRNMRFVLNAKRYGWLATGVRRARCNSHSVYMFAFPPVPRLGLGISVYIGLTSRRVEDRRFDHIHDPESSVTRFASKTRLSVPEATTLESGLSPDSAAMAEQKWIDWFADIGWNVLNKAKGGGLGGYAITRMTREEAIAAIDRYSTLKDFRTGDPITYATINRMRSQGYEGWDAVLDYRNTRLASKRASYTYEGCLSVARKCRNIAEMMRVDKNAYQYAYRHGLICKLSIECGFPHLGKWTTPVIGMPVSGSGKPVRFGTVVEAARFAKVYRETMRKYVHGRLKVKKSLAGYYWKIDDSKQNCHMETRRKKGNPK